MPSQRCRVFNCHNGGPFRKVCKTRKANVHEVRVGRTTKVEQRSEEAVNFPGDDSAHSLFLGTFSAEHPKGKTTVEQLGRSKVMTRFSSQQIHSTNTPQPQSAASTPAQRSMSYHKQTTRKSSPSQQPEALAQHNFLQPMGATRLNSGQFSIICTPQWQYQEGNLHCDRCSGPSNTWV